LRTPASFIEGKSEASLPLETHIRKMFDPARRDYQAVQSRRVEHEAQCGVGHGFLLCVGRLPQLLDRGE
jgi:hypothetical protein